MLFFKKLTQTSDYLVDWSMPLDQLLNPNFHYSKQSLIRHGKVLAYITTAGFLAAWANNPEKTHCPSIIIGLVSALGALPLTHIDIIYPMYQKRVKIKDDCDNIKKQILSNIDPQKTDHYNELISDIYSLTVERATATWLLRRKKLTDLLDTVMNNSEPEYTIHRYRYS